MMQIEIENWVTGEVVLGLMQIELCSTPLLGFGGKNNFHFVVK